MPFLKTKLDCFLAFRRLVLLIVFCAATLSARAQNASSDNPDQEPLATKQQIVRNRMSQLEDRMYRLAEKLAESDPRQAENLIQSLRQARELLLRRRMEQTIDLLKEKQYTDAADEQETIRDGLENILRTLLADPKYNQQLEAQIEQWEKFLSTLQRLATEQKQLQANTAADSESRKLLANLKSALARTNELQSRQDQQIKQSAADDAAEQSGKLADDQQKLHEDTQILGEDIKELARSPEKQQKQLSANLDKASQQAGNACKCMRQAAGQLRQGQPRQAGKPQREAADALKQMADNLQKQIEKLAEQMQLPTSAKQQQELQKRTAQLAEQMQNPSSEQSNAKPAPGAGQVQQAGQSMQNASDALNEQYPREAELDQQQALQQLQKAQQQLQNAIDQKRQQQMQTLLRELTDKLEIMLAEQQGINQTSQQLANKKQDTWTREDSLQLAELSKLEKDQLPRADEVLQLLTKDQTTVIFPQIMQQVREDMVAVAQRLRDKQIGLLTLQIEADIEAGLQQLLDTLKRKSPSSSEQQDSGQGQQMKGKQKRPMLIPPAEELKLLRAGQQRINQQTQRLEARFEQQDNLTAQEQQARGRLSKRQAELGRSAKKLLENFSRR
jgi:hypothetical protein